MLCKLQPSCSGKPIAAPAWHGTITRCFAESQGTIIRAAEIYRRILERLRSSDDRDDSDVATIYHNLGGLEHARGRHAHGEPFAREAVRIRRAVFGANHPLVAADEVALGAICDGIAKHGEARRLYSRALRIFRSAAPPDRYEIAVTLNNLAASYYSTGQIAQAERYFKQALSLKEEIFGRRDVDLALTLNNLALVYRSRGRKDLAKTHYLRAISIFKRALPAHHPKVKACQKNYVKLMQSEKISAVTLV